MTEFHRTDFTVKRLLPSWERPLPVAAAVAIAVLGALSMLPYLADAPGLHSDEAWVGVRAWNIYQQGDASWFGTQRYTGPLHQLLVALSFRIFGPGIYSLRGVGVVANAIALGLYAWVSGQLFGRRTAALACALLAVCPWFVVNSRSATEHGALGALLALGAVAALLQTRRPTRLKSLFEADAPARPADDQARRYWAILAGLLLGLGSWNHLLFLSVPATLLLVAIAHFRTQCWRRPEVLWTAFAWLAVELGPLLHLEESHPWQPVSWAYLRALWRPFLHMWQGDAVSLHALARVPVPLPAWELALLAIAGLGLLAAAFDVDAKAQRARWVLLGLVGMALSTAAAQPLFADRHFLLPLLLLPWVLTQGLDGACAAFGPRGRTLATLLCVLLAAGHGTRSVLNVVLPMHHGAMAARGAEGEDAGMVQADTRSLYDGLCAKGVRDVVVDASIGWPLAFWDLRAQQLDIRMPQTSGTTLLQQDTSAHGLARLVQDATFVALRQEWDPWFAQRQGQAAARADIDAPEQHSCAGAFLLLRWPADALAQCVAPAQTTGGRFLGHRKGH